MFDEKYELGKKIGEGANGLVRECLHKKKNKKYAVKTMMMDEEHIVSLKNNFFNVRELNHPNIVRFKALYLDMKKHLSYLVMEYITYPNLLKYINSPFFEKREEVNLYKKFRISNGFFMRLFELSNIYIQKKLAIEILSLTISSSMKDKRLLS